MLRTSAAAAAVVLALGLVPGAASAGPCSDDIAAIGKQLAAAPQLGPPTTGTLSGSVPSATSVPADTAGTTASGGRVGGTAGTKELDTAAANVATSPADVRQQQLGKPTAAQLAAAAGHGAETAKPSRNINAPSAKDDGVTRAKLAWQQAVDLNARNDVSCKRAVHVAQDALRAG